MRFMRNKKRLYNRQFARAVLLIVVLLVVVYVFSLYYQKDGQGEMIDNSPSVDRVAECLTPQEERSEVQCFATVCEDEAGYLCAQYIVDRVTALKGPEDGMRVLQDMSRSTEFVIVGDTHQLAHVVGRSAAENHGSTGDIFNRCPFDFEYGCVHGFFESAMAQIDSLSSALVSICDSFGKVSYDKEQCYHAGGHGIMMNESYDFEKAVSFCEELPTHQGSCLSGVFMENAIGFVAGRVPPENVIFSPKKDWLAPCNKSAKRYREHCYEFHHRYYLPYAYSAHLNGLIDICLGSEDDTNLCLSKLAASFAVSADNIVSRTSFPDMDGTRAERAAYLCNHFPEEYVSLCHTHALARLIWNSRVSYRSEDIIRRYCSIAVDHQWCDNFSRKRERQSVIKRRVMEQVATMSLDEKIGQMMMLGISVTHGSNGASLSPALSDGLLKNMKEMIDTYHVGGVLLAGKNIHDRDYVETIIKQFQEWSAIPLFIAVDQEGVFVRLDFLEEQAPQFEIKSETQAYEVAHKRAKELREVGVTMNFSPVVEYVSDSAAWMYERLFQTDSERTGILGSSMVKGYFDGGIIPVIKHLPGYGNQSKDPHTNQIVVNWSPEDIDTYLHPFKEIIKKNPVVPVMAGHVTVPSVDIEMTPCSSTLLSDILRGKMGHTGVIITDAFDMQTCGTQEETAVKAINAGVDVVFPARWLGLFGSVPKHVKQAVLNGDIPKSRIDESVIRILTLKYTSYGNNFIHPHILLKP